MGALSKGMGEPPLIFSDVKRKKKFYLEGWSNSSLLGPIRSFIVERNLTNRQIKTIILDRYIEKTH